MKEIMQIGVAVCSLLSFAGCVAEKVTQPSVKDMKQVSETKRLSKAEVSGIEPSVTRAGDIVSITVNLLGSFDIETRTFYVSSLDTDEYMAVGCFPGVMSCKGEYGDCLQNAAGAFFYNLVFAGLPTVYGLLMEPCIPYHPPQTDSIVCQTAFLKSTLIGFSRYSKPAVAKEDQKVNHSVSGKMPLEDAIILAPDLSLESGRGQPLQISVDRLPPSGDVIVKLRLPEGHLLKKAMSDFEDVEITIKVNK